MHNVATHTEVEGSDRNRPGPSGRVERSCGRIQINRAVPPPGVGEKKARIKRPRPGPPVPPPGRPPRGPRRGPAPRPADPISTAPARRGKADVDDRVRAE